MSLISNITKVWAAKRIFNLLSADIKSTNAFKLGIVDADGNQLIKQRDFTSEQKRAYGPFEKIIFYIRRVLMKHGIVSLAMALTYIENENFEGFKNVVMKAEMAVNDPAPSGSHEDDFNKTIMLLENALETLEDAPTTSTTGVATTGGRNLFGKRPENEKKGQGQKSDRVETNKDAV